MVPSNPTKVPKRPNIVKTVATNLAGAKILEAPSLTAKAIESTSGAETSNLPLLSMLDIKFVTTGVSNKVPETTDILLIELLASLTPSLGPVNPLIILVNTLTLLEK